jgi:hypothetical protein
MNTERAPFPCYIPVAAATAGNAADIFAVSPFLGKSKVARIDYVSDGGVTANNTNYATFTATVAGTTIGTMTTEITGSGDIADGAVESLTLTAAGSNLVAEGGVVKVAITKAASGVAIAGTVSVVFERVAAD